MNVPILYSALDCDGVARHGFIHAESNKQALNFLQDSGFTKIQLYDDANTSFEMKDLERFDSESQEILAKHLIRRRSKSGLLSFIAMSVDLSKALTTVIVICFLLGVFYTSWLIFVSMILLIANLIYAIYKHKAPNLYDDFFRHMAWGNWDKCGGILNALEPHMQSSDSMRADLGYRRSQLLAATGQLEKALEFFAEDKDLYTDKQYVFLSQSAVLRFIAGDFSGYLSTMRQAYSCAPEEGLITIDFARAEARYGNPDKAVLALENLDHSELIPESKAFVDWVEGLISAKKEEQDTDQCFIEALTGMAEIKGNPIIWISIALCAADFGIFIKKESQFFGIAKELIMEHWEVIKVHVSEDDENLLENKFAL